MIAQPGSGMSAGPQDDPFLHLKPPTPPMTPVIYACARDGWIVINNVEDGSYLIVDSRRGPGFEDPYWVSGTFPEGAEAWVIVCGESDDWTPRPPRDGVPEDCSTPTLCPQRDPDGPNADLRVVKVVNTTPPASTIAAAYTIMVTNFGPDPAINVVVTDALDIEGGVLLPVDESRFQADFGGVWTVESEPGEEPLLLEVVIPMLPSAATATLHFAVVAQFVDPTAEALLRNTATVSSNIFDPNQDNNEFALETSFEF